MLKIIEICGIILYINEKYILGGLHMRFIGGITESQLRASKFDQAERYARQHPENQGYLKQSAEEIRLQEIAKKHEEGKIDFRIFALAVQAGRRIQKPQEAPNQRRHRCPFSQRQTYSIASKIDRDESFLKALESF